MPSGNFSTVKIEISLGEEKINFQGWGKRALIRHIFRHHIKMDTDSIKKICFDYFSGKTDSETAKRLEEFLDTGPDASSQMEKWEKEWASSNVPSLSQLKSFAEIKKEIHSIKAKQILRWTSACAATVALIAGAFLLIPRRVDTMAKEEMLCIVETGFREKTKVILPDSTLVWLNAASRISYNKDFLAGDRIVRLEGEAFFDVKKSQGRKFVVDFGTGTVNVLGTKFNVSSYGNENICEVALLEGSVEFVTTGAKVDMVPGDILILNTGSDEIEKIKGEVAKDISWMDNKLDYSKITLDRLLKRLSSIYGVKISYFPSGREVSPFGVILNLEESLPNILDGLTLILPVKWDRLPDGSFEVEEL